jgi:hypothetical protein
MPLFNNKKNINMKNNKNNVNMENKFNSKNNIKMENNKCNNVLNPNFVTGLTDTEGCFSVRV